MELEIYRKSPKTYALNFRNLAPTARMRKQIIFFVFSCFMVTATHGIGPRYSHYISEPNNDFGLAMHTVLAEHTHENMVYSPFSLRNALATLLPAAARKTQEDLSAFLTVNYDMQRYYKDYGALLKFIKNEHPKFKIFTNLFISAGARIKKSFAATAINVFGSSAQAFSSKDSLTCSKEINTWVNKVTEGALQKFVTPYELYDASLSVVNVVKFKDDWQHKFSSWRTKKKPFHLNSTHTINVDTMAMMSVYKVMEHHRLKSWIIALPYSKKKYGNFVMILIVPKEIEGLHKVEKIIRFMPYSEIIKVLTLRETHATVSLPKFVIDTTIDFRKFLQKMGFTTPFQDNQADFSEMTSSNQKFYVSWLKQNTILKVHEEGTEAISASIDTSQPMNIAVDVPKIYANRPFMGFIHDTATDMMIYSFRKLYF